MKKKRLNKIKDFEKKTIFGLKITSFLLVILGILVIATVVLTIETSASGAEMAMLESEEELLKKENKMLKAEIIESTSLSKISKIAQERQLKKATKIIYITEEETVAKLP